MSEPLITPGNFNPRFARVFMWYTRRLFRKSFHSVHLANGSRAILEEIASDSRPILGAINHPSWWDPLTCALVHSAFFQPRPACAPIDAEQLERFKFMRKIGLFGIDPQNPRALAPMIDYVTKTLAAKPHPVFWITPQGAFTDSRSPISLRPGAAAVAARIAPSKGIRAFALAVEYIFWHDQRPEVLLRAEHCTPDDPSSTASWHRALTSSMQRNADALTALSIARDESAFEPLLASSAAIHPVYDLWLRIRGKSAAIEPHRGASA